MKNAWRIKLPLRLSAMILAAVLMCALLPADTYTAYAESGADKQVTGLGVSPLRKPYFGNGGWCKVYYLSAGTPLRFKVLNTHETSFGGETLLLDCDSIIGRTHGSNSWDYHWDRTSQIQNWLGIRGEDRATDAEIGTMHRSAKSEPAAGDIYPVYDPQGILDYEFETMNGSRLFVLDAAEAMNVYYGFPSNRNATDLRKKDGGDYWLRSKSGHWSQADSVALVNSNGSISKKWAIDRDDHDPKYQSGISPAVNIPLNKILFSTLVSGVNRQPGSEYKLTLIDNSPYPYYRGDPGLMTDIGQITRHGNLIKVPFNAGGIRVKTINRISYLVTNKKWNETGASIIEYGKLDITSGSMTSDGEGSFELPEAYDKDDPDHHVYIFAETVNEDKKTDYASEPVELDVPPASIRAEATPYEGIYDGKAHSISVSVDPGYATVRYGTEEGRYDLDKSPAYTDAGEYTVYYRITAEDYDPFEGSSTVKIDPRPILADGINVKDKLYDGTTVAEIDSDYESAISNRIAGDDVGVAITGTFHDANVGENKPVALQYTITGEKAANYVMDPESQTAGSATINIKTVTVSGIKAHDKVADDSWMAELDFDEVVINGKVDGDDLSVTAVGNFNSPDLTSQEQTVWINHNLMELTGSDKGNYLLDKDNSQRQTTATIWPNGNVIIKVSEKTHVYDGQPHTIKVTVTDTVEGSDPGKVKIKYRTSENGTWQSDPISIYATDVGSTTIYYQVEDKNLLYEPNTFEGAATLTITPKPVSIIAAEGLTKVYDGTTNAPEGFDFSNVSFDGKVGNDDIIVTDGMAVYDDAGAGDNKTVLLSGLMLGGDDADNYTLEPSAQVKGTITKRPITVSGIRASDKEYDGNTDAEVHSNNMILRNVHDGDEVTVTASGSFERPDVNVDTAGNVIGRKVNISFKLSGDDAANYYIDTDNSQKTTEATIHRKDLAVGASNIEADYDGKEHGGAEAYVDDSVEVEIKYGESDGEACNLPECPKYRDAGLHLVYFEVIPASNNYNRASGKLLVNIHPRELTITEVAAEDKVYDGKTDAVIAADGMVVSNMVENDHVSVVASGSFEDAKAGKDKKVSLSYKLSGDSSLNYFINKEDSRTETTADILKREVTVSGITAYDKVIDGQSAAELDFEDVEIEGVLEGDDLSVTAVGNFEDPQYIIYPQPVIISELALNGEDKDNYVLASEGQQTKTEARILPNGYTIITVSGKTHEYDGKEHSITVNVKGTSDDFDPEKVTISYKESETDEWHGEPVTAVDAGRKTVYYRVVDGNILGDNTLEGAATLRITPKPVTVSAADGLTKVYDGTTKATEIDFSKAVIDGKVGDDDISVAGGTAVYDSASAGDDKTVLLSGMTLEGAKASNYKLAPDAQVTGKITRRPIRVSGVTASDKDYDGSTDAMVNSDYLVTENLVNGDDVIVTVTGSFEDAESGKGKTVNLAYTLSGTDADNYYVDTDNSQKTTVADINKIPEYTITYSLNGGEYNGSTDDIVERHESGTTISIHEKPEREGYTFLYWEGSEYQPGDKYKVTGDHTFTAKWSEDGSDAVEPVVDPENPDEPVVDPENPDEPVVDPENPDEPVIDPENPDEPVIDPENPDEPVVDPENPDEPVVDPENPDEPVVDPENPDEPVVDPEKPEEPVIDPENPDNPDDSDNTDDSDIEDGTAPSDDGGSPGTGDGGFGFDLAMLAGSASAFLALLTGRRRKSTNRHRI